MPRSRKYALADWPAPDRAAWEAATSTEVSFLARGPCAHSAPETKRQAFCAYARWLAFLAERDPPSLQAAPDARLTRARLERFASRVAKGRTAQTVASTLNHLVNAVHAIAPDTNVASLRAIQARFRREIRPRDKRPRMVPPQDLYALGFSLMNQAAGVTDARAAARTFRDGLIIVILVSSTLRRKNLAALVIGRDLHRIGSRYEIAIDATATKTKKRIDHPLPDALTPYLDQYLHHYRLQFAGANRHEGLWPSTKGGPMCPEAIWDAVRRRTRTAFGHPINLHLVRDIAATRAPQLGSPLLGHGQGTLTDRHYRRSDPLAASRKLARVIATLRAHAVVAVPDANPGRALDSLMAPITTSTLREATTA